MKDVPHEYGPSRVGHGEAQCIHCHGTNRENAVISPNHCEVRAAAMPASKPFYMLLDAYFDALIGPRPYHLDRPTQRQAAIDEARLAIIAEYERVAGKGAATAEKSAEKNWALWRCYRHERLFAAHAGCSLCVNDPDPSSKTAKPAERSDHG